MRDEYEERDEHIRMMLDHEPTHTCEMCGESDLESEMIELDGEWFHEDCGLLCDVFKCEVCGEVVEHKCQCGGE